VADGGSWREAPIHAACLHDRFADRRLVLGVLVDDLVE
jgi:hypothetical protein